jgi:hypothetical protein
MLWGNRAVARDRRNVFEQLIEVARYYSLGKISHALYDFAIKRPPKGSLFN